MYEYGSDLYEAFWEGYRAQQNDGSRDDNPYDSSDAQWDLHKAWVNGWYQAGEDS